jgi:hypothetical protein
VAAAGRRWRTVALPAAVSEDIIDVLETVAAPGAPWRILHVRAVTKPQAAVRASMDAGLGRLRAQIAPRPCVFQKGSPYFDRARSSRHHPYKSRAPGLHPQAQPLSDPQARLAFHVTWAT